MTRLAKEAYVIEGGSATRVATEDYVSSEFDLGLTANNRLATETFVDDNRPAASYVDAILAEPTLKSYWRMGSAGPNEPDIANNLGNLVMQNNYVAQQPGLVPSDSAAKSFRATAGGNGGARSASGLGQWLFTGGATAFGVECLVKANSLDGVIVTTGDAFSSFSWRLHADGSGGIRAAYSGDGSWSEAVAGGLSTGVMYHVGFGFRPSDKKVRLYINGALAATGGAASGPFTGRTDRLAVGTRGDGFGQSLDGFIQEVAIYDDEPTAAMFAAHVALL